MIHGRFHRSHALLNDDHEHPVRETVSSSSRELLMRSSPLNLLEGRYDQIPRGVISRNALRYRDFRASAQQQPSQVRVRLARPHRVHRGLLRGPVLHHALSDDQTLQIVTYGSAPRGRLLLRKSSTDEMRVCQ